MKTYHLLLTALLFVVTQSAMSQGFNSSFTFEIPGNKPGISVTNKSGTEEEFRTKEKLLQVSFEKALTNYIAALSSNGHPLKKTLGPIQSPISLTALKGIDLTVMMKEKDDPLELPSTWRLPSFGSRSHSFVTHIPYKFLKEAKTELRLDHLALHEIGHIVAGHGDKNAPEIEEMEKERNVEYIVYQIVGREKYLEFYKEFELANNPELTELALKVRTKNWLQFLGIEKSDTIITP